MTKVGGIPKITIDAKCALVVVISCGLWQPERWQFSTNGSYYYWSFWHHHRGLCTDPPPPLPLLRGGGSVHWLHRRGSILVGVDRRLPACNKGNRRRLHAGKSSEEPEQWTGKRCFIFFSYPCLALRPKCRVRLAWLIKRQLCSLVRWGERKAWNYMDSECVSLFEATCNPWLTIQR